MNLLSMQAAEQYVLYVWVRMGPSLCAKKRCWYYWYHTALCHRHSWWSTSAGGMILEEHWRAEGWNWKWWEDIYMKWLFRLMAALRLWHWLQLSIVLTSYWAFTQGVRQGSCSFPHTMAYYAIGGWFLVLPSHKRGRYFVTQAWRQQEADYGGDL